MKIKIEFTDRERTSFMNAVLVNPEEDKSESVKGNFGSMLYDRNNRVIECDLKESFVIAFAQLTGSMVGMLKTLLHTCEMFGSMWFENVEKSNPDENKENLHCPVRRLDPEEDLNQEESGIYDEPEIGHLTDEINDHGKKEEE